MLAPLQSTSCAGDFGPLVNVAKSSRLTKETLEDSDSVNVASRQMRRKDLDSRISRSSVGQGDL